MNYIIITPVKDEEDYILYTLQSIINQTLRPIVWIIVNDGSTDNTVNIINSFRKNYDWIKLINSEDIHGKRAGGVKVVRAFNKGLKMIKDYEYDFIVKLDADLTLPDNYFEEVSRGFESYNKVGLCGGYTVIRINSIYVKEKNAEYYLSGPIKAYRKECFEAIGGLPNIYLWDGIDQMKAMYLGWEVKKLQLEVIHHRPTSTETNKGLTCAFKAGKETYLCGYDFILAFVKSVKKGIYEKPIFIGGLLFIFGFFYALFIKKQKHVDPGLEDFIRKFQYNRIKKLVFKTN